MSIPILVLAVVATLAAVLSGLRLVRRVGRVPWLLLGGALLLIAIRRLWGAFHESPGAAPSEEWHDLTLAFAVLMLLGVQTLERLIQEVRRLQNERQFTTETYDSLVANLPLAAVRMDIEGNVRFLNPVPMAALSGYAPEEHDHRDFWLSLVHPEDLPRIEDGLARVLKGEPLRVEARLRHKDGGWRWAETLLYPHRSEGQIRGVNALVADATEKRFLEDQLRQAQKMEALGAMAGGVAHDFNNLLSSILGNTELAGRKIPRDHPARKNLDDAARAALRASEHSRQLLGFSRRTVVNPQAVSLNDVCHEAVALVKHTVDPRIEFQVRTVDDLWQTSGDPTELVQLLVNLLLNARDALPDGGRVQVETGNATIDDAYARTHPEAMVGDLVTLVVADNGPGMTPAVRSRVFEPFFTTKPAGRGTGLGLAMVYGTVRRHEGWIECHSEPGHGTRFSVHLPRRTSTVAAQPSKPAVEPAPRGSETVLLVDDEADLRAVGVEALEELGYSVLTACDGLEALTVFEAERKRIRLVILDLSMPRLSGRDTLARLRGIDPAVRVLVTSGHAVGSEAVALVREGAAGFVEKPYRLDEMAQAVRRALGS